MDLRGLDRVPTAVGVVQAGLEGVPLSALVAADATLRRRLVTTEELSGACAVLARCRGIGPVRAILREADARVESPGESIVGHRLRALGYTRYVWAELDDVALIAARAERAIADSRRWRG
ncbi:MAG TPA: hypothetical protein VFN43_02620 [Humibacillus sp.]|nr:hypothetical protein [Humibacillus sp.]